MDFYEITQIQTYFGDNQNGHFPPHYSVKTAIILSNEPNIALNENNIYLLSH
jgi:hypothetical protein